MLKKIAVFTMAVLMVTSLASAQSSTLAGSILQTQAFTVAGTGTGAGMATVLNLVHGDAMASSIQCLTIDNVQAAPGSVMPLLSSCFFNICGATAFEAQNADLKQTASTEGNCGIISVSSYLDAAGAQTQGIGSATDPKGQVQSLGVAADQVLLRSSGSGGGVATNVADLCQVQAGANAAGSVMESSNIGAFQVGVTGGAANSTVTMANTMTAATSQAQQVF
jgi:hypothetical protein